MTSGPHPNVRRVESALRAAGAPAEVRELTTSIHTAEQAAAALGVPVGAIVKSLVFHAGDDPVLVLTSGAHRVDTDLLGDLLGAPVRRADADEVRTATGQPIGGVAPVGHPAPLRTLVDESLAAFPVLWAAAGTPRAMLRIRYDDLVALTGAQPVVVAARRAEAAGS